MGRKAAFSDQRDFFRPKYLWRNQYKLNSFVSFIQVEMRHLKQSMLFSLKCICHSPPHQIIRQSSSLMLTGRPKSSGGPFSPHVESVCKNVLRLKKDE